MTSAAAAFGDPVGPGRRRAAGRTRALPGLAPGLAVTLGYLALMVVIPLTALIAKPWSLGVRGALAEITDPRALAALRLSFGLSALAAACDLPIALLLAWTLTRYRFPGRRLLDAMIDLPFALPTAVAGIALTTLLSPNGWVGALGARIGLKLAYNATGIFIALVFIGLPFIVRQVEPVLADLDREVDDAARTLGATDFQRTLRVILPPLIPSLVSGYALAFARGLGEYGSVIFIAGNLPMRTEIAPLLIVIKLEQFDYAGAAALGVAMVGAAFACLLALGALQLRAARRRSAP